MISKKLPLYLSLLILVLLQACVYLKIIINGTGNLKLTQVDFQDLPGWQEDDQRQAVISLLNSCKKFSSFSNKQLIGNKIGKITAGDFRAVCEIAAVVKNMSNIQARNFFENWFQPFLIEEKNGNNIGKFTGYYEPELRGSKVPTEIYKYPIYARPLALRKEPFFTRKEITNGALSSQNLEILYVDDKIDLFFLHIQGSGIINFEDNTKVKIAYDSKNNHPYSSIGSYLAQNYQFDKIDLSSLGIKKWLKDNPHLADEVMNINQSYIFFRLASSPEIIGAQMVPLTKERSLAIDNNILPYGFPIWVSTSQKAKNNSLTNFQKLMITQDTGSAIKGTIRGDIFFGNGETAEVKASTMNAKGRYYILLPNEAVNKIQYH
jgi:membrane-bound lytic murein transglycosylase A